MWWYIQINHKVVYVFVYIHKCTCTTFYILARLAWLWCLVLHGLLPNNKHILLTNHHVSWWKVNWNKRNQESRVWLLCTTNLQGARSFSPSLYALFPFMWFCILCDFLYNLLNLSFGKQVLLPTRNPTQ